MNIIKPSIFMKSSPSEKSLLETECLFGENVEVLDEKLNWVYCKLLTDKYCGWVNKEGLGKLDKPTHRIAIKRTFIYEDRDPKSNCLLYLPMGSKVSIEKIKYVWAQTYFVKNKILYPGYVPSNHIVILSHKLTDWVTSAELLEGTPYKWGGRDSMGIDCSALLQLSYQSYGEVIPRNTSQQINLPKKRIDDKKHLKRGCVIFWEGHVGIMTDKINCIHANAFHMKTTKEPLTDIINRMGADNIIKKMMNFN